MVINQLRRSRTLKKLTEIVISAALTATLSCSEFQNPLSPQPLEEKKRPETKILQKPMSPFKQGDFASVIWTSPDNVDGYYIQIGDKSPKKTDKTYLDLSSFPVGAHRLLIRAVRYEDDQELIDLTPEVFIFRVEEPDIRILARYYLPQRDIRLNSLAWDGKQFVTLLTNPNNFHKSILRFSRTVFNPPFPLEGLLYSGIASDGDCYWTSRSHELRQLDNNFELTQPPLRFDNISFHLVAFDTVENTLWSNGYSSRNYRFFKHNPEDLSVEDSYLAPRELLRGFTFHNGTPYTIDIYGKKIYQHRRSDMILRKKFSLPQSSSITLAGLASDGKALCALAYDPLPVLIEIELNQESAP